MSEKEIKAVWERQLREDETYTCYKIMSKDEKWIGYIYLSKESGLEPSKLTLKPTLEVITIY